VATAALVASLLAAADPAEAGYAAYVVEARSGTVLHQTNGDLPNYPASLTKMMTLYLAFEALEKGILALDDRLPVSAHAAARPPSKLGLKPGQSIRLGDAIQALATKSANDVATVIAEHLAGSEERFAKDDAPRPPARHDPNHLPQRLGPARPRAAHHRARHRRAGAGAL
jgi:D-alanyl-D-alanine carboxypeptidase